MSTCEVMLTALVAAFFFANNLRLARQVLAESGLVPYHALGKPLQPTLA